MPKKIDNLYDSICLSIVHTVTKQKTVYQKIGEDEFPESKEVQIKQIHVRKWFKKDGITSVEEYVTSKNTVAKNRSIVFDKYSSRFYATFHAPGEVMTSIHQPNIPNQQIGFYDHSVHSRRPQIYQSKKRR